MIPDHRYAASLRRKFEHLLRQRSLVPESCPLRSLRTKSEEDLENCVLYVVVTGAFTSVATDCKFVTVTDPTEPTGVRVNCGRWLDSNWQPVNVGQIWIIKSLKRSPFADAVSCCYLMTRKTEVKKFRLFFYDHREPKNDVNRNRELLDLQGTKRRVLETLELWYSYKVLSSGLFETELGKQATLCVQVLAIRKDEKRVEAIVWDMSAPKIRSLNTESERQMMRDIEDWDDLTSFGVVNRAYYPFAYGRAAFLEIRSDDPSPINRAAFNTLRSLKLKQDNDLIVMFNVTVSKDPRGPLTSVRLRFDGRDGGGLIWCSHLSIIGSTLVSCLKHFRHQVLMKAFEALPSSRTFLNEYLNAVKNQLDRAFRETENDAIEKESVVSDELDPGIQSESREAIETRDNQNREARDTQQIRQTPDNPDTRQSPVEASSADEIMEEISPIDNCVIEAPNIRKSDESRSPHVLTGKHERLRTVLNSCVSREKLIEMGSKRLLAYIDLILAENEWAFYDERSYYLPPRAELIQLLQMSFRGLDAE